MNAAMTLQEAIKKLGGVSSTSRLTGIARTTIHYWLDSGVKPPAWREADVARIIAMAKSPQQQGEAA